MPLLLVFELFFLASCLPLAQAAADQGQSGLADLRPPLANPRSAEKQGDLIERPEIKPFVKGQAIFLKPYADARNPNGPLTLYAAVRFAEENYPRILQSRAEMNAAKRAVTLQKIKEYNPGALMSYQQVVATHNKLTQILFSSPVLPPNPGPGLDTVNMHPQFFSGTGFIVDWAPIDFGLHKARIQEAKANYKLAQANYAVTQLDVAVQAASTFLTAVITLEQVRAAEANVSRFQDFSRIVHSEVTADLKPAADASLADAQLANSQNDLIRARLAHEIALAEFANTIGLGGEDIKIDPGNIALVSEPADLQQMRPQYDFHPFALQGRASILKELARRRELDKEYYPVFRFLGGMNFRGSSLNIRAHDQSQNAMGFAPAVSNWNVGAMVDFPFMDILRIQAQKKVVDENISAQRHGYNLILQNLRTQDRVSKARVKAAVELASNMPVQVAAALKASRQAEARYQAGLGNVAQVAQANQVLADSRVKEAVAKVGVWQALLAVAAVHGELRPFIDEARRLDLQRGN